jgi:hypothetical protein
MFGAPLGDVGEEAIGAPLGDVGEEEIGAPLGDVGEEEIGAPLGDVGEEEIGEQRPLKRQAIEGKRHAIELDSPALAGRLLLRAAARAVEPPKQASDYRGGQRPHYNNKGRASKAALNKLVRSEDVHAKSATDEHRVRELVDSDECLCTKACFHKFDVNLIMTFLKSFYTLTKREQDDMVGDLIVSCVMFAYVLPCWAYALV